MIHMKIDIDPIGRESYFSADGATLRREFGINPVSGMELDGKWVLRDKSGKFLDCDQYRHDIAERNDYKLESSYIKNLTSVIIC